MEEVPMLRVLSIIALLSLALAVSASGATVTYDVKAFIDGQSLLIFQGDAVQWHNLAFTVPGLWNGHNEATIITTTVDGTPVMNGTNWYPVWNTGTSGDTWSDQFSPLNPTLPNVYSGVLLQATGRESLTIDALPTSANGYQLVLNFDDYNTAGADWYEALVTFTGVPDSGQIPEPASFLLIAPALGGLAALRRKFRG
jgi:hypothetical protein